MEQSAQNTNTYGCDVSAVWLIKLGGKPAPYIFSLFDAQYKYWIICSWFRLFVFLLLYSVFGWQCTLCTNNNNARVSYNYKFYVYGWANAKVELNEWMNENENKMYFSALNKGQNENCKKLSSRMEKFHHIYLFTSTLTHSVVAK